MLLMYKWFLFDLLKDLSNKPKEPKIKEIYILRDEPGWTKQSIELMD